MGNEVALDVERVLGCGITDRNRCADPGDLNRCIFRPRRRTCESASEFAPLSQTSHRVAAPIGRLDPTLNDIQGKAGQVAARRAHCDLVVLDQLGYLPFSGSGAALLFHLLSKLYEQTSVIITNLCFGECGRLVRRREDDHRAARPAHSPLPYPRNRKRKLPLQEQLRQSCQTYKGETAKLDERLTLKPSSSRVTSPRKSTSSPRKASPSAEPRSLRRLDRPPWSGWQHHDPVRELRSLSRRLGSDEKDGGARL